MYRRCNLCAFVFERESGYFLGAIYFNYGITVALAFIGFFLALLLGLSFWPAIGVWVAISATFPLWFFRRSRALWIAFDLSIDPATDRDFD